MTNRRKPRPRYKVGMIIQFGSSPFTRPGVGTVTWVTERMGNLLSDGKPNFLYRVEVETAYGKATRFVFEYQVQREVKSAVVVKAA